MLVAIMLVSTLLTQDPSTAAPELPRTRAERTDFAETSSLADVKEFLGALQAAGAPFTREVIGTTTLGHDLLLVTVAEQPTSPSEARRDGKLVIYVQANIHGGEVEGKESVQILLREITAGRHASWLEHTVLLITPIYNVDGNETLGDGRRNRASQNGPAIVGRRSNGQGLDLNRDCTKAETPEMRAVLRHVYGRWDPDVIIDLHATNGTRHGYHLTYSPPLDPNTEATVLAYTRDDLLPTVRTTLANPNQGTTTRTFDYGNFRRGAWRTFGAEPRYVTNYAGTRNRIGILSEATSYLPFDERVRATNAFVIAVLDQLIADRAQVRTLVRNADATVRGWGRDPEAAPALGVRFEIASRGEETVLLEDPDQRPGSGPVAPGPSKETPAEIFDRFRVTETAPYPGAYFIPAAYPELVDLLIRHGVHVERLSQPWSGPVDEFVVEKIETAENLYQGHPLRSLTGEFNRRDAVVPAGDHVIRTSQRLGVLAFTLLEPQSLDGAAAWGFLDRGLRVRRPYPIRKGTTRFQGTTETVAEKKR